MANLLTGIRMVCSLGLIFSPTFSAGFYVLYLVGGITDVLDGAVARQFGKETKLGAVLDTLADTAFAAVVIVKLLQMIRLPLWLVIWIVGIAAVKILNIISGFVRCKRFISEHTVMNKLCGILLFAIPLGGGWLSREPITVLIVLTCGAATFAAFQEGYYIRKGKEIR